MSRDREAVEQEVEGGDEGFMLLTAIVMIFIVLLTLSVAAPTISRNWVKTSTFSCRDAISSAISARRRNLPLRSAV